MQLSKSEFMMFLKHPAWLWLKKHDKDKLPEPDANLQAIFDAGVEFEQYAYKLFPDGQEIGFDNFSQYRSMPKRTTQTINTGAEVIFQGRFEANGLTCITDILKRVDNNTFDLYEVKSSTKVKKEHYHDLSFQIFVLESAGYDIRNILVIHVNKEYVRDGEIDPEELTATTDVTAEVRDNMGKTEGRISVALDVMKQEEMPDPSPRYLNMGSLSDWMDIYKNIRNIDTYSIYNLVAPGKRRLGELEDMNIELIQDIPDDFNLTAKQQAQVQATKRDERIINEEEIHEFLGDLTYPLYFLDYETAMSAIPPYDGSRPYQQIPFQYSLHTVESPEAEVQHTEYLHRNGENPVPDLLEKLRSDIGDHGSVIVWYQYFETKRNEEMGDMCPQYKDFLEDVNNRVVDLMDPFKNGWFVDKEFFGSASIKYVLPVVVPELSYKNLDIQEGGSAQRLWMDEFLKDKGDTDKEKLCNDLVEYCKLDTLAMVKIWEVLRDIK